MKHFVVEATYRAPIEQIREAYPRHRAWLQKGYDLGLFLCSGPQDPPLGGFLVARANSRADLETLFREEPLHKENLASFKFTEFQPVKRQPWTEEWFDEQGEAPKIPELLSKRGRSLKVRPVHRSRASAAAKSSRLLRLAKGSPPSSGGEEDAGRAEPRQHGARVGAAARELGRDLAHRARAPQREHRFEAAGALSDRDRRAARAHRRREPRRRFERQERRVPGAVASNANPLPRAKAKPALNAA